jgi:zinc finger CCHC domain-containing protein 9|eukprot:scaffold3524_cov279-Chaetoceros_neogracile.AAC.21
MAKRARKPARKLTKLQRREKYTQQARDRREKATGKKYNANTICFNCRRKGHAVADCPKAKSIDGETKSIGGNICYKCGSYEHSLKNCGKLTTEEKKTTSKGGRVNYTEMDLPFATCFICKKTGHLSSQCEQNENGLYVKGGCCKKCGSKKHLFQYCPERQKKKDEASDEDSAGDVQEFLEEDPEKNNDEAGANEEVVTKKKKKIVNF